MKNKFIILSFLFTFIHVFSFGQDNFDNVLSSIKTRASTQPEAAIKALDSLKKSKKDLPIHNEIKIDESYAFCYYYKGDFEQTEHYFKAALSKSKSINDSLFISKIWNNLGVLNFALGKYDRALIYYDSTLVIKQKRKDTVHIGNTLMNMANVYNKEGYYITATKYYYQALHLFEQLGMQREQATTLLNIGTCELNREEYTKADSNFHKAYRIFSILKNSEGKLSALNNMGTVQLNKNQNEKAKKIFQEIIRLSKIKNDSVSIAYAYNNLGQIAIKEENWNVARKYIIKSTKLFKKRKRVAKQLETQGYLAIIKFHIGDKKAALSSLDSTYHQLLAIKGIPLAVRFGVKYADYLSQSGNFKRSSKIYNQVRKLQNKIYSDKQILMTKDMEAKYHFEEQAKEIQLSKKKREALEVEKSLQESRFEFYILGLLTLLLLIIGFVFFIFYRNKQKNKIRIQKEKINKAELEYRKLRNDSLQVELKNKNNELSRFALHISEKKRFLQTLSQDIKKAKTPAENKQIYLRILQNVQSDKESKDFYEEVNQFLSEFRNMLTKNYNTLTIKDIRLCSLIQLNLSSKDIAAIFNISPKSVDMRRYRLRKKMDIPPDVTIENWLRRMDS